MTHIDTGTLGAKVQSWRKDNPRNLLKRMIEESPKKSKDKLLREFNDYVRSPAGMEYLDAIIEYWFSNNWHSLAEKPDIKGAAAAREARTAQFKSTIKTRAVEMVFLDFNMPNGKALRDCTGAECKRAGGWFAKIAAKIKPAEKVGNVLSEQDLRNLFQQ